MRFTVLATALLLGGFATIKADDNLIDSLSKTFIYRQEKNVVENNILVAYIEETGVYLNDEKDSSIEDSWKNTDTKILKLNIDCTKLDSENRYLKINLPLGMKLDMDPKLLVDGKNIISMNNDNFAVNSFEITNKNAYIANQGELIFEISPNINSFSKDILVSVDNKLWNTVDEYACKESEKAIMVSVGDENNCVSKKIDKIKIIKNMNNNFYGTDHNHLSDTTILDTDIYNQRWFYANQNYSILKEIIIEMEIPYVECEIDAEVVKKYLDVKKIVLEPNWGAYEILDNKIVFKWKNIDISLLRIIFNTNASSEKFLDGEKVKLSFSNMRFKGVFDTEYHKLFNDFTLNISDIVDNKTEKTNLYSSGRTLYYNEELNNETVFFLGRTDIQNKGIETSEKILIYDFSNNEHVGVSSLGLFTNKNKDNYEIEATLYNYKTGEEYNTTFCIDREKKNQINITVKDIVNNSLLNIEEDLECLYIKNIKYNVGRIESKFSQSSYIYGKILPSSSINSSTTINFNIVNSETDALEKSSYFIVKTSNQNVAISGAVDSLAVKDENNKTFSTIEAGHSINISGNLNTNATSYNGATYKNPEAYLILPKGLVLNSEKTYFTMVDSNNNKTILDFDVTEIDNMDNLNSRKYLINIHNNKILGYYNEDLKNNGYINFNFNIEIKRSTKSQIINVKDMLFFADKYLNFGGYKDDLDVNNNGDVKENIVKNSGSIIKIISNSFWLDVDNEIVTSGGDSNKYKLSLTDKDKGLTYNLIIDNINEGFVDIGDLEYYIPIPKKNLVYNENVKPSQEDFNFEMELACLPGAVPKHKIMYSYNNEDFFEYNSQLNLSKVSMVKIINTEIIEAGDNYTFSVKMNYKENSWDNTENKIYWSAYGVQTYTKNGVDSSYTHVFDPLTLLLKFSPEIIEQPTSVSVNVGDDVNFTAVVNLGAPISDCKWQYRISSTSEWVDSNEIENILTLNNVSYSMNGYQYKYIVSNEVETIESDVVTLSVIDVNKPSLTLTKIKEDGVYKIRIDVVDEDSGVSHIILPDGSRINSSNYTLVVEPNNTYTIKAYDTEGNETIETITVVEELELKSATSSLDVYIKSQNMISLSLNTNSVSFENYSGASPVEKLGAININVNSSLPYTLNAYLPSEIQSSSGSKIDINIFKIRESSSSEYSEFTDTVNKLILKDNCLKGNNINHVIDLKLDSNSAYKADVYKATVKFEVEQK